MNAGRVITIDSKHSHHKSAYQNSPLHDSNGDTHSLSFTYCNTKPQNPRLNISALEDSRPRDRSPLLTERRSTLGGKVYEMLRELEPSLPAIPTAMTEDQTLEYIKVATAIMRRRQTAAEQQLKVLISELQSRESGSSARTARTARDDDRRRLAEGIAVLEAQTKEVEKTKTEIAYEREQTQKQVQFINRKIEEIEQLETRYQGNLKSVKSREEELASKEKMLEKREKEFKSELEAGKQQRLDLEKRRNALKMTEKTLSAFAKSLEAEKEQLNSEKQIFVETKTEWMRTHRQDQAQMSQEDIASHYLRISSQSDLLTAKLSSLESKKVNLESAFLMLETAQDQLASDRQEVASLRRSLTLRLRDAEAKEKALKAKEAQLSDFEQSLLDREARQNSSTLEMTERERSDSPVQILTAFSFRPQHSKDSRYRIADLSDSLQTSLTPRDVITPESTEQSRDDFSAL